MRRFISRLVAPHLAVAVAWLGSQLELGPELISDLETGLTTSVVIMLYGLIHVALDAVGVGNTGELEGPDDAGL